MDRASVLNELIQRSSIELSQIQTEAVKLFLQEFEDTDSAAPIFTFKDFYSKLYTFI